MTEEEEIFRGHAEKANESAALWKTATSHELQLIILCAFLERLSFMLSDCLSEDSISLLRTLYDEIWLLRKAEEPKILKKLYSSKHLSPEEQRNRALLMLGYDILTAANPNKEDALNRLCEAGAKFDLLPKIKRRDSATSKKRLQQALNNTRSKSRLSQKDYGQAKHTYALEKFYMRYVQATTQCSLKELAEFYLNNYLPYTLNLRRGEPDWPGGFVRERAEGVRFNPDEEWGSW